MLTKYSFKLGAIGQGLRHLDEQQIRELIIRYYLGGKKRTLIEEFRLNISVQKIETLFPIIYIEDEICPRCNSPMYRVPKSTACIPRSSPPMCVSCHHITHKSCLCAGCTKIIEQKKHAELVLIRANYKDIKKDAVSENKITLRDRLYLGSLLSTCFSEAYQLIWPLDNVVEDLAPTREYTEMILHHLHENKFIVYSAHNPSDIFKIGVDGIKISNYFKTIWELNIKSISSEEHQHIDPLVSELSDPKNLTAVEDIDECVELWKEVSLFECLKQLEHMLAYYRLYAPYLWASTRLGNATRRSLNYALQDCSMCEIRYILGITLKRLIANQRAWNCSFVTVLKSLPKKFREYVDRFHTEVWPVEKRGRDVDLTPVSKFFYKYFLNVSEDKVFNLKVKASSLIDM